VLIYQTLYKPAGRSLRWRRSFSSKGCKTGNTYGR